MDIKITQVPFVCLGLILISFVFTSCSHKKVKRSVATESGLIVKNPNTLKTITADVIDEKASLTSDSLIMAVLEIFGPEVEQDKFEWEIGEFKYDGHVWNVVLFKALHLKKRSWMKSPEDVLNIASLNLESLNKKEQFDLRIVKRKIAAAKKAFSYFWIMPNADWVKENGAQVYDPEKERELHSLSFEKAEAVCQNFKKFGLVRLMPQSSWNDVFEALKYHSVVRMLPPGDKTVAFSLRVEKENTSQYKKIYYWTRKIQKLKSFDLLLRKGYVVYSEDSKHFNDREYFRSLACEVDVNNSVLYKPENPDLDHFLTKN